MNTRVFFITAKTNLHVGNESGGEFSIIDKAIQRDPLTNLPCINSSSLKGAIKQYCVQVVKKTDGANSMKVSEVFGSDIDEKSGKVKGDTQKGKAIFFDAKLLYLPQQDSDTLFHYVTTKDNETLMNNRIKLLDPKFIDYKLEERIGDKPVVVLEDKIEKNENGHDVVVTAAKQFKSICDDVNLPIIARNMLENGESKNLWYEQVLPAETILYAIIQEENDDLANALDNRIVQIGAGATIGYGYCQFKLISKKEEKK